MDAGGLHEVTAQIQVWKSRRSGMLRVQLPASRGRRGRQSQAQRRHNHEHYADREPPHERSPFVGPYLSTHRIYAVRSLESVVECAMSSRVIQGHRHTISTSSLRGPYPLDPVEFDIANSHWGRR